MIPVPAIVWQVGGAVALVGLGLYALNVRIELATARDELRECQATNMTLNRSMITQNVRIETWQAAASQAQANGTAALAKAATVAATHAGELERLRVATPSTCTDAVRQVREGLKL